MNKSFTLFILSIIVYCGSYGNTVDWGATGHRTVGEIAQQHLSKRAEKQISDILNGQSLAMVSTYGDDIKSDKKYDKYYTWHFVNFPFDTKYEASKKDKRGDIVMGIQKCIEALKDPNTSQEDKSFYLKFLVHLVGDLHQPLHVGKAEDRGGNDIKVLWHYDKSNLHRVWDSEMIESFNMSYTELAANSKKLSKEQIKIIQKGSILDWTYESQALAKKVYASAKMDEKLGYRYSYDHFETVQSQLQKSGIRLAKILNEIFG
ncbi:S1/P1 nuclease [Lutimonas saemankumensis]|uniref:S1/P1 nuclease n=1 Tax=Lutimonas saemankumensis TaxID=483016 RepID=UPI001CD6EB82|nr:S1/P1 nuclease [Lutimonas saemankumensis]MCA0931190.1 S1/P1 nuclease [Lutimonas saemankumensis]